VQEQFQNSKRWEGVKEQAPYGEPTNIRRYTQLRNQDDMALGICASLFYPKVSPFIGTADNQPNPQIPQFSS
jgi:hypothetical protein